MNDLTLVQGDKDVVLSRTQTDIKIMQSRPGAYKALVHVESGMDHVTFSSRRVNSIAQAEAIAAVAAEILSGMLEKLGEPPA